MSTRATKAAERVANTNAPNIGARRRGAMHLVLTAVAAWTAGWSGCAATPSGGSTAAPPTVSRTVDTRSIALHDRTPLQSESVTLHVRGLACPLCAHNVDKQLLRVAGVRSVEVDLGSGEVRVALHGAVRPSPKQITDAVEVGGFTLERIDTP